MNLKENAKFLYERKKCGQRSSQSHRKYGPFAGDMKSGAEIAVT